MGNGIPYFPLDVALDTKFALIEAEFGLTGFGIVVKLLQSIYGEQGYYLEWTDEVALLFAQRVGAGGSVVSEIVAASIKRGIFDETMYQQYSILTSRGIQDRYIKAVSRRVRVEIKSEYLLLCNTQIPRNVYILGGTVGRNGKNVDSFEQSKVKKSKVEKSKVEESKADDVVDHIDFKVIFNHAEHCFGRPITPLEVDKLQGYLDDFEDKWVKEALTVAGEQNARNFRYVDRVLENWQNGGYKQKKAEKIDAEMEAWLRGDDVG